MAHRARAPLVPIHNRDEIPAFASEADEAEFWSTHSFGPELLAEFTSPTAEEAPPTRRTRPITLRIDEELLARIQTLAVQQHKPYQRLMKEMLLAQLTAREQPSALNAERAALIDELVGVLRADIERVLPKAPAILRGQGVPSTLDSADASRV
jgi:predicted DNA binding CopG/RHH family protein